MASREEVFMCVYVFLLTMMYIIMEVLERNLGVVIPRDIVIRSVNITDRIMLNVYKDPGHARSFGGIDSLHRAIGKKVSKKQIRKWLEGVDSYTLHKPVRHNFVRNRIIVYGIDEQWQADLVDLVSIKKFNRGNRYILTCIDILSKYAWVKPLERKTGESFVDAFREIFLERKPKALQSDAASEFKTSNFRNYSKSAMSEFSQRSIRQRLNITLKTCIWKYFTSENTYNYVDVLDRLIESYNTTYHSSIKMPPADVNSTRKKETQLWMKLFRNVHPPEGKCRFETGETMRIS